MAPEPAVERYAHLISYFGRDSTFRWSFRKGDFLFWFRWGDIFAPPESAVGILDFWELLDGDNATITNRQPDLPNWFELHPSEVANTLAFRMMEKLENGYEPGEIIDGPNIWRVRVGDRLVWVGEARPGQAPTDSILAVIEFSECALVLGEELHAFMDEGWPHMFGSPMTKRNVA